MTKLIFSGDNHVTINSIVNQFSMLHIIKSINDPLLTYVKQDPVRPSINIERRIGPGRSVFVKLINDQPGAIVCVSYQNIIPSAENQLFEDSTNPSCAIFYTIWSYKSGCGKDLIHQVVTYLRQENPKIKRYITLSPKTEMARKFHLKNGATVYSENLDTVNYEYIISDSHRSD